MTVRLDQTLRRRRDAAPRARALLAEHLGEHTTAPESPLPLVVTELVANAVVHGRGTRIAFRVEADDGRVRVEVENRCWTARPRRRLASHSRPSGRGLTLVAALADDWGVSPARRGRARVWAELPLPTEDDPRLRPA